jgi:hypothetical protein
MFKAAISARLGRSPLHRAKNATVAAGRRRQLRALAACALGVGSMRWLAAQTASAPAETPRDIDALLGAWQRTDGNYIILVRGIGAFGQLEATYFNPRQLPFSKALATRDGQRLRVTFELSAAGYDGSVYELSYDRASDRLLGSFYQAVAKQRFDVVFERKRR